ncbi:hypothetical protein [Terribacillus saccharophilus]|uniref:hypothetical protein n=1 Tax=Terribacillus saccharophilus TaxID=361277 RepID=UPI002DC7A8D7|nr:hypothetical protein [Terribacillus saccharophilus]
MEGTKHVQIYAQSRHHNPAYIIGNEEGLRELIRVIETALSTGCDSADVFPSDGEGYKVLVKKLEPSDEKLFESLEMPYTEQYGPRNTHSYYEHQVDDPAAPYPIHSVFQK